MKKAGIITMVGGSNYGNVLQNYAVQQLLLEEGYEPYTLNNTTQYGFPLGFSAWRIVPLRRKLRPDNIAASIRSRLVQAYGCKNSRDLTPFGILRAKKNAASFRAAVRRREEKFDRCRAETLRTDPTPLDRQRHDREQIARYDAFVCGSDQIWNPFYWTTSSVDFLDFAPMQKRIALAPSFGVSQFPPQREGDFGRWLRGIPHLSVREDAGAEIIRTLTGREVPVLLDPTFALSAKQWQQYAIEPEKHSTGDYVLTYFLGNKTGRYARFIRAYAEKKGYEIVDLYDVRALDYYDIEPREFVWLLTNAKAIFTDSFHGAALSINLHVPFVVFERVEGGKSMSSRISTLLDITGLSDRRFPVDFSKIEAICFDRSDARVAVEREAMKSYLHDALLKTAAAPVPALAGKYHCSGCGACRSACPADAIRLEPDVEGFFYPVIDAARCINCLACERACPADRQSPEAEQTGAFYAYAKNEAICAQSSSGGLFTLLAEQILRRNGVVYGAGFDDLFRVCHMRIERAEDLPRLRMSKYVQSDTGLCMRQVKADLHAGIPVLFSGTPCQIAGLRQYLGRDFDNLYTQDIICHGVPSPSLWQKYCAEQFGGRTIRAVSFRDKTMGWNGFGMRVCFTEGPDYFQIANKDPFERAFLANLILRPSCHQCQYKTVERFSDITLADYWGVEEVHPELKGRQGVSLVLTHTEKGEQLMAAVKDAAVLGVTELDRAVKMNHAAEHSVRAHRNRGKFFERVNSERFAPLVEACLRMSAGKRIKRFIRRNGSRVKQRILRLTGKR